MRAAVLVLVALLMAGCASEGVVVVRDAAGAPVEGATVVGGTLSTGGPPVVTDAHGRARLRPGIPAPRWVEVTRAGCVRASVDAPAGWPLAVTLVATPDPARSRGPE